MFTLNHNRFTLPCNHPQSMIAQSSPLDPHSCILPRSIQLWWFYLFSFLPFGFLFFVYFGSSATHGLLRSCKTARLHTQQCPKALIELSFEAKYKYRDILTLLSTHGYVISEQTLQCLFFAWSVISGGTAACLIGAESNLSIRKEDVGFDKQWAESRRRVLQRKRRGPNDRKKFKSA